MRSGSVPRIIGYFLMLIIGSSNQFTKPYRGTNRHADTAQMDILILNSMLDEGIKLNVLVHVFFIDPDSVQGL